MSLREYIIARYGNSEYKETTQLKNTRINEAKVKNQLIFLQRCIANRLIPKTFRIKSPVKNARALRIIKRYRRELLVSVKNDVKKKYFHLVQETQNLQNKLQEKLTKEDFEKIRSATEIAREKMFLRTKAELKEKFEKLKESNSSEQPESRHDENSEANEKHVKEGVLNLCNDDMKQSHRDLLNLGPKFVPRQNKIPWMDLVARTESTALKLEFGKKATEAQDLRKNVLRILKMNKSKKDNLTREQRTAMKEIKEDKEISIYPFDKGIGFVRIKNEEAIEKIREQIGETTILEKDPTPTFAAKVRSELSKMNRTKIFTKAEYELIYPSDPLPPRLYGVIKAHKPQKNYPMRTIVSTVGTVTHGLSEYLVKLIQPALNKNISRIKNSRSFVEEAKTWAIDKDEVQVSYDVVNLYPKVPLAESTTVILEIIRNDSDVLKDKKLKIKDVKKLIELCLSRCYFIWNGQVHELKDSGPIGLSLMVVMAEGFLQHIEAKALNMALHPPKTYRRYVDDSHARFNNDPEAEEFKTVLNQQHPNIQYTMDRENSNKELEFLDIKTKNSGNGQYEFTVHRKDAITNIQVKPHSDHDPKILQGIFKGFVHRAINICSPQHLMDELNFLKTVFIENGYKETELSRIIEEVKRKNDQIQHREEEDNGTEEETNGLVSLPWIPGLSPKLRKEFRKAGFKVVFKSGRNLSTILTSKNKPQHPPNSHPGVYRIHCANHPENPYIGHTKKQIRTRIQEHQHYISRENWDKSGAANHSRTCDGIQWSDVKTVCREKNQFEREVREALEIQRERCDPERGGMNVDLGKWVKTTFWLPFFKNLRITTSNKDHRVTSDRSGTNNAITSGRQNTDERSRPHSNERSSESNT